MHQRRHQLLPVAFVQAFVRGVGVARWVLDAEQQGRAPPNSSASGPTKPIVPPQPIATGSLSKPLRKAPIAASKAGPFGSVIHHFTGPGDFGHMDFAPPKADSSERSGLADT